MSSRARRLLQLLDRLHGRRRPVSGAALAADLMLAAYPGWYMGFGAIGKRPSFEACVARHWSREAAVRAKGIDDAASAAG